MKEQLDKMEAKIDKLGEDVTDLKVVSAQNSQSLIEHMNRTKAAEEHNKLLETIIQQNKEQIEQKLAETIAPIAQFVDRAKYTLIVIGSASAAILFLQKVGFFALFL